jgi:hypothetical protein
LKDAVIRDVHDNVAKIYALKQSDPCGLLRSPREVALSSEPPAYDEVAQHEAVPKGFHLTTVTCHVTIDQ